MKTYPMFNEAGVRTPVFQIENIYIGLAAATRLLSEVKGVTEVRRRKMFTKSSDVHVEFKYMGQPYIVLEPYGDNSRYWIGPADMVAGADDVPNTQSPTDLARLEDAFKHYRPAFHRALLGDMLTLRFITRFTQR